MFPCQRYHLFRQQFQGTVQLRQTEKIRDAQQDHKQGVVEAADDLFIGDTAEPSQDKGKPDC